MPQSLEDDFVLLGRNPLFLKATSDGDHITSIMKDYRTRHLARLAREEVTPLKSLIFTDMLAAYRRMKDHALNIAEALAAETYG